MTTSTVKTNLLGLTQLEMEKFFDSIGEKRFRAGQVMKWIHHFGVDDFDAMTNVSKALREKLKAVAEVRGPEVVSEDISSDGTRKWVVRVASGSCVETVYIPQGKRGTLCVSSQAGCALDCSFCSTGKQGFNSNLTAAEVIGQVWIANKSFGSVPATVDRAITNVVMMGMGEPLLNFDNVVAAMHLMMDDLGYGISKRRVTLSTSGVVPMIDELSKHIDVSLALSLHAPNDALRNQLVPINKKYPLKMLLESCQRYMSTLGEKRVLTIEYTLLKDINDKVEHAVEMIELLKNIPCKINLIPFNPFPHSGYERPSNNAIRRFQDQLHHAGFNVTVRTTRGEDIDAACGQLVGQVLDRTRRSERYIAVRELNADSDVAHRRREHNQERISMSLRFALLLLLASLCAGCVLSGDYNPMKTSKGRDEAREAYVQLGIGYLQQGMTERAKVPLKKALELDGSDPDANAALGLVFQAEMEPELADEHFRKALSSRPADARILNNYGSFLFEQKRYKEAYERFEQAAADTLYPERSRVFENLGMTAANARPARSGPATTGKSPAPEPPTTACIAGNG